MQKAKIEKALNVGYKYDGIPMTRAEFVESKGDSAPKTNYAKPQNDPLDGFMDIPDEIGDEELPFG